MHKVKSNRRIGSVTFAFSNKSAVMQIIIFFLTFFTLMTPRDALGLKKLFLGLALIFGIPTYSKGFKKYPSIFVFSIILPAFMYTLSTIMTGVPLLAISYLYPFIYLFLIFPIIKWNIDIEQITLFIGNIMAFLIVFSAILDITGVWRLSSNKILKWLHDNGEAQITFSQSPYAMFLYVIFLKSSPIMLYNLMHYIKINKILAIVFSFSAILFSGTRANIFLATIFLIFAMLFYSRKKSTKILITVIILLIFCIWGYILFNSFIIINEAKAAGDQIRLGTVESIIKVLNTNKLYYFTGMGFGSKYHSIGRMGMVTTSELSYLEFIREVGVILFCLTFFYIIYPLFKLYKSDKFTFLFYVAYLVSGAVEPFIFTSTGFFIIMLMYVKTLSCSNNIYIHQ